MESQLEVVRTAYRLLVDESRIPVDAKRVAEAALSVPEGEDAPWGAVRAMARAVGDPHTVLIPAGAGTNMQRMVTGGACTLPGFAVHRTEEGFVVGDVEPGSVAGNAGLRSGDVVLAIDGTPMSRGFEDLVTLMAKPE